ncbi:fatty acid desaturase (plasmid) [Leptolyngbya boryana NIES-2135]|jgi:fatty acid desaturase|uniref:Fatty acid desaturase n=1 Tax=Leptolyngbya boryana NIES-2135 TaxID=1973484 RepID=A0A1Z4JSA8_LEPBY|nr:MULTISPECIES: fatty acid desaturase [Leptolyngbya]BAY59651.1 fatty acid desaturase [Leptolyngbya boryana NIES-2135]MBD2371165.1 fatty acid desaturase [Leptolyngbya sp. FACHB-161]MBD2377871.1 fatty acid desaturase [Leptolyngbya sp. FACHB-238]MBD2402309.1 fatty acid desaturase [Leptolyngbya sp. FACHB-239]MBD2409051.1 fatty acid desaturase [Leptolyngbya sp. FACHB-402]
MSTDDLPLKNLQLKQVTHDLRSSVADLNTVNPWIGLLRFCTLGFVCLSLIVLAWLSQTSWGFVGYSAIAGFVYAIWFICTHDATHHTLTGWVWFDEALPRLMSYPMLWMHSVYAQIHRLHHGWNGTNLQDPERVQWTLEEYENASVWMKWYVRHQWQVDLFVLGGLGMIAKTIRHGWQFGKTIPAVRRALLFDAIGIVLVQASFLTVALFTQHLWQYIIFWCILERVIGVVVQARDHLEHYGMWSQAPGHQLTQLYSSRNLTVHPIVGWLVGGLNYHSVHHAFPSIPFDQLPEAFRRIESVLKQHDLPPMTVGCGYVKEVSRLSTQPSAIGTDQVDNLTGRYQMLNLS